MLMASNDAVIIPGADLFFAYFMKDAQWKRCTHIQEAF